MIDLPRSAPQDAATARRELVVFLLVAFAIIGAGIGLRDPWPSDEPRFALVAKQMVESGDWLFPHRGSELYSDKPPTLMVVQAAVHALTDNWRIAFLLPSLLASLGTLFLVYDLGKRLWNPRTGLWAGVALLATFQFVYQSKRAQIDPLVMFFITLGNYGLLRHLLLGPSWRAYWLGCFAAGLGVITKGVGVIVLLMFAPYLVARWRGWQPLAPVQGGGWRWAGGAVAFLAAIALWIVPMVVAVHANGSPAYHAYMNDILFSQTAERYANSWDHHQPFWYYAGVIAFSWIPLSFFLPGLLPAWRERLRARDARFLLPLGWVALVLVFFSIPNGKRDMYIMPALPWVALVAAPFLADLVQRRGYRRLMLGFVVVLAVLFAGAGVAAWSGLLPRADRLVAERGFEDGGVALWAMLIGIGATAGVAALVFRERRAPWALASTLAGLWLAWGLWGYPHLNASTSAAEVMRDAGAVMGPDAEVALVAWKEQNLLHVDRPARDFGFTTPWHEQLSRAILWQREMPATRWVFVLGEVMEPCIARDRAVHVGNANRRDWWLFRADAVEPACRDGRVPAPAAEKDHDAE